MKMKSRIFKLLFILSMIFMGGSVSYAFEDGDVQYWNRESASIKINDDWKFNLEEEFRFGDDISDFFYQHSDVGFSYSGFADWLDVSINYRAVLEEKSNDWTFENRPHLNATLKTKVLDAKVSNRSRLEFRIKQASEDKLRYRNKTTIKFPVKFTKFELQPYIADEIFIDFQSVEATRNRFYVGFGGKLFKLTTGGFYYMIQSGKSSGLWKDTHVLGTKLKVSF